MSVFEKIKKLLDEASVKYRVEEHEPVFTSQDAAKVRGVSEEIGAKALVCRADKKYLLVVVPGNKKVDFKKFKKLFGIKDMTMANPEKVKELTTLEVGSIPPIGKAINLTSYYDNSIKSLEEVAFNAGKHEISIFMRGDDLIKIENPIFASFVKS